MKQLNFCVFGVLMLFHISLLSRNIKTLYTYRGRSLMIFCLEWSTGSNKLATYGIQIQVQSVHVRRVTYSTEPEDSRCRPVAYPGILFGGGGSTNSVEDR